MEKIILENLSDSEIQSLIENTKEKASFNICVKYISAFTNAKKIRVLVDGLCKKSGIASKWVTRFVLIADELNNNAIEYGSRQGDTNVFCLKIEKKDDKSYITMSVQDTGLGNKPKKAEEMNEARKAVKTKNFLKHTSIRGRGLFLIINNLVDDLSFYDNTTGGLKVEVLKTL